MIGKKINQLATELAPASTDLTIIGDPISGVSKKITIAQLGAIFSGAVSFYDNFAAFPATGDINVIYCAKDTKKLYLWSGSAYVEVFPSQALLDTYQLRSEKGNANGYASLDSGGKVPISQLPSSIMEYKGTWNAATNTPTLANGTGDTGDVYICNVAGTVNFGAGPLTFAVGDYVIYSGSIWQRSSGAVGTVTSVAASITGDAIGITGSPITTSGTLALAFAGNSTQYINGAGNLVTFPGIINEAQNLITEVYNKTGATLTKGTIVYINGGQGNLPSVTKALATGDSTSAQTYGIVRNDITNNNNGYVVVAGRISDLDTQAYTEGTQLYLSPTTAGTFTSTKPYAPQHLVYVGIVVRAHPTQGVVEVKIQNGYELDELHNVAAQTPTNNDGLFWESATNLWKNKSIATILGYTPQAQLNGTGFVKASGTTITYDNNTYVTIDTFENITASKNFTVGLSLGSAGGTNQASVFANTNSIYSGSAGTNIFGFNTSNNIYFGKGLSNGGVIAWNNSTSRTYNLPDADGTIALVGGSGVGTVTSVAALTIGTTGTDITSTVANSTTTPVITLNVPTASATNRGALSSADWTTFNNKQNTLTNPVTGTGTTNYIAKFTGTSTIGNSLVFDNGTNVGIGTNSPTFVLDVNGTLRASANVTGTDNVAVFHNTNTTTGGTPVIALSTASTGIDAPADIRLAGTNTKGIRIYAADSTLTSTPLGAGFQMFSVSSATYPGQMFFDSGANNNAFIAFRTTVTSGTITERMRITANGNISIGNTNDTFKLDVSGTGRFTGALTGTSATFSSSVTANSFTTPSTGAAGSTTWNLFHDQYAAGDFSIWAGSTTRLLINAAGNVGIGTTSPLSISGYTILSLNNATNGGMIDFQTNGTTAGLMYAFSNSLNIGSSGTAPLIFLTASGNERMRITSGGNVGIGTTSPTTFSGNTVVSINNAAGGAVLELQSNGTSAIRLATSSSDSALWEPRNVPVLFATNNTERMRITSVGNVGIGTTSPGNRLAILGPDEASNPTLGTNAGKFGIFNGVGAGTYGMIMGVINNGNSYLQVQRIDGTATAYNLLLQPSGGNVGIGIATANPTNFGSNYTVLDVYNGNIGGYVLTRSPNTVFAIGADEGTNVGVIQTRTNSAIVFATNTSSERMRITSGGLVGIGTSSPATYLHVEAPNTSYGQFRIINTTSIGEASMHIGRSNQTAEQRWTVGQGTAGVGDTFGFYTAGSNKATLTTAGVWSTTGGGTSDLRTKQDIEYKFDNGIESLLKLQPTKFKFKSAPDKQRRGFIAQDVLQVIPDLVLGDGQLQGGTYGLDYDGILALAVKAIQELKAELDTYTGKNK